MPNRPFTFKFSEPEPITSGSRPSESRPPPAPSRVGRFIGPGWVAVPSQCQTLAAAECRWRVMIELVADGIVNTVTEERTERTVLMNRAAGRAWNGQC